MQTERVTILMTPAKKAALAARAAARSMSIGQYVRRKVEDEDDFTGEQEAELALLVAEVNKAVPRMAEQLDAMSAQARALHDELDAFLREKGVR
jgi:SpoVK/Ycf46/Vps4 family AAA+-type ATPase